MEENDYPDFKRASGLCICSICRKEYYRHPYSDKYVDYAGNTYLNVLCDGSLVKL